MCPQSVVPAALRSINPACDYLRSSETVHATCRSVSPSPSGSCAVSQSRPPYLRQAVSLMPASDA